MASIGIGSDAFISALGAGEMILDAVLVIWFSS